MKKTLIAGAALAALLSGSMAFAQPAGTSGERMRGPDANQDGTITSAEVQANVQQRFARMDANRDGRIDQADRAARQAERFTKLDTDGSGEVSLAEMTAGRETRQARHAERIGGKRDMRGGRDGAGTAMRGDRRGAMQRGLMRMDANNDGAITLDEMEAGAMVRFNRQDTNNDGQVSSAERDVAREAMKQRWQDRHSAPQG